jgi:hypothetical protein
MMKINFFMRKWNDKNNVFSEDETIQINVFVWHWGWLKHSILELNYMVSLFYKIRIGPFLIFNFVQLRAVCAQPILFDLDWHNVELI